MRTALAAPLTDDAAAPACSSLLRQSDARQAENTGVDRDLVCTLPEGHEGRHLALATVREADAPLQEVFAWDARGYVVRAATQKY